MREDVDPLRVEAPAAQSSPSTTTFGAFLAFEIVSVTHRPRIDAPCSAGFLTTASFWE